MAQIIQLASVTSLDGPDAVLHRGVLDVNKASLIAAYGDDDTALVPADIVQTLAPSPEAAQAIAVAVEHDTVLGYVTVWAPLVDNRALAEIYIAVHPEHRRQGLGSQLYEWTSQYAHGLGRTIWHGWADGTPPGPDEATVRAPTGDAFPAASPGYQFAIAQGFALEQVARFSVLHLPVDVAALKADALARADGYVLHTWTGLPPDEWLDDYAAIRAQVTIDAPAAGLAVEKQVWDAERLRRRWAENAKNGNHQMIVAAEHAASGRLVAFTAVIWHESRPDRIWQGYTFVMAGHHGHRLGLLVKTTLLDALVAAGVPARRIYTDNAGENAPMLAINTALGFRLHSLTGAVQKKTDA